MRRFFFGLCGLRIVDGLPAKLADEDEDEYYPDQDVIRRGWKEHRDLSDVGHDENDHAPHAICVHVRPLSRLIWKWIGGPVVPLGDQPSVGRDSGRETSRRSTLRARTGATRRRATPTSRWRRSRSASRKRSRRRIGSWRRRASSSPGATG